MIEEPGSQRQRFNARIFVVACFILSISCIVIYLNQVSRLKHSAFHSLSIIETYKLEQIDIWLKERSSDAYAFMQSPFLSDGISEWICTRTPQRYRDIRIRFASIENNYNYYDVYFTDPQGKILVGSKPFLHQPDTLQLRRIEEVTLLRKPILGDLYSSKDKHLFMDVYAPFFEHADTTRHCIGVLLLRVDAERQLLKIIRDWPTKDKTGMTILARRDDIYALFINNPKFTTFENLSLRIPLNQTEVPAVQAIRGKTGEFEGIDYRQKKVLAVLSEIEGTSWYMVNKIDRREALETLPMRLALLICIAIILLVILWRLLKRHEVHIRNEYEAKLGQMNHERILYLAHLEHLFHNTRDMILLLNREQQVLEMNEVVSDKLGFSRNQLLNRPLITSIQGDHIAEFLERLRIQGNKEALSDEFEVIRQAGTPIIVEAHGSHYQIEEHEYYLLIFHDLTARKTYENAIMESEERFRSLYENSSIGLYRTSPDGNIQLANPTIIKLLGYGSFQELVDKNLSRNGFSTPGERLNFLENVEKLGSVKGFESVWVTKEGGYVHIRESAVAIRDQEGKTLYYDGTVEDITPQKLAESALKQTEANFHELFENMLESVVLHKVIFDDAQNIEDYRIVDANLQFFKTFQISDEILGKTAREVFKTDTLQDEPEIRQVLQTQEPYQTEMYSPRLEKHFTVSLVPWEKDGFAIIYTDITSSKKTEAEMKDLNTELEQRVEKRTSELVLANRELEAFSYSVSHDLRAPLRSISSYSNLLKNDYGGVLDQEAVYYLDRICSNAEKMARIIEGLLNLAKYSRAEPNREVVSLSQIADQTFQELVNCRQDRKVEVMIQEGMEVDADPMLLGVVMYNLLGNALKFTKERELARVEVGVKEQDGRHVYFVKDNGVGFNMDYVKQLFGVFRRLHDSNDYPGTGIGLATVKRIIERHDGRIWAEGVVGSGAVFYFTVGENGVHEQD